MVFRATALSSVIVEYGRRPKSLFRFRFDEENNKKFHEHADSNRNIFSLLVSNKQAAQTLEFTNGKLVSIIESQHGCKGNDYACSCSASQVLAGRSSSDSCDKN